MDQQMRDRIKADYLRSLDIARQLMPEGYEALGAQEPFTLAGEAHPGAEYEMRDELETKGIETHGEVKELGLWLPKEYGETLTGIDKLGIVPNQTAIEGTRIEDQPVVGDARAEPQRDEQKAIDEYDRLDNY